MRIQLWSFLSPETAELITRPILIALMKNTRRTALSIIGTGITSKFSPQRTDGMRRLCGTRATTDRPGRQRCRLTRRRPVIKRWGMAAPVKRLRFVSRYRHNERISAKTMRAAATGISALKPR